MDIFEKLSILADAAKYDVACTSSGVNRSGRPGMTGNAVAAGICHSFAADGRCISLLKVLMSNACVYDCKYCVNRVSRDTPRTSFTPRELADLTMGFYRRNYIEGLFLSSGVLRNPDYTMEHMLEAITLLREEYRFNGYIHVKTIPGASEELVRRMGFVVDRMSVNIELPTESGLEHLAPQKSASAIIRPMAQISQGVTQNRSELALYRHAPKFAPAGQSTQMIVGATPDSDYQILRLSQGLYRTYQLKRVFFSAYTPIVEDKNLPSVHSAPPLLREHRLYQADWLMRFYGFKAEELVSPDRPNMNLAIDPKCHWAVNHMDEFPVEVLTATYGVLLRVPGIGVKSAQRIIATRAHTRLTFEGLKKIGVVLKRARYFITCGGRTDEYVIMEPDAILRGLLSLREIEKRTKINSRQMQIGELGLPEPKHAGVGMEDFRFLTEGYEQAGLPALVPRGASYERRSEFGIYI